MTLQVENILEYLGKVNTPLGIIENSYFSNFFKTLIVASQCRFHQMIPGHFMREAVS